MIKRFFCLLVAALGLVTAAKSFAADEEAATKWKFSVETRMDAASRNFTEMSRLEKWKTDEISRRQRLQSHIYTDQRVLFVTLTFHSDDGSVNLKHMSHMQFGYGDLFPANTITATSSNGSGWERPNFAYIKYCRDF